MKVVRITESKQAQKDLDRAPQEVLRSYEVWARIVEEHGVGILRGFSGYRDEALRGVWQGFRSSRLNLKWRVIYKLSRNDDIEIVNIVRVTAHDYRRK